MKTRLKVLVSAYSCEPGSGSEPGVGWDWIGQIARYHDVWALTRANNRAAIERAIAREPLPGVRWIYYDLPAWARFWKRGKRGVALYYYLWQAAIFPLVRRAHRETGFDLIHHVTFGKYWAPSFISLLDVPFVWGPVGGAESAPASFWKTFSWRGRAYEAARVIGRAAEDLDPFVRMTARRSALGLAKTAETARTLERLGCRVARVCSEVSLPAAELRTLGALARNDQAPLQFLSTGRLLHWKGFHLGLEAFARFEREFGAGRYVFIGNGPERRNLERMAARLGVDGKVSFRGNLPRSEVLAELARSHVLVHPSLHDSGGWVCIEAMAAGRPVICLDCGGPAMQVTPATGCKIPADTPARAIGAITAAMLALARDAGLRERLGEGGRRRVAQDFLSDHKAAALAAAYDEILGGIGADAASVAAPSTRASRQGRMR